MTVRRLTIEND